jgi:hypothetical protein
MTKMRKVGRESLASSTSSLLFEEKPRVAEAQIHSTKSVEDSLQHNITQDSVSLVNGAIQLLDIVVLTKVLAGCNGIAILFSASGVYFAILKEPGTSQYLPF